MLRSSIAAAALAAMFALTATAQVQTYPASYKYKDSSVKNATGRSGDAAIEARALLNRDNTATLELTSGSFDPASSNGAISKVQVKSQSTSNFNSLDNSGFFSANLGEMAWHTPVAVEAHVDSVSGSRTDVVDANAVVVRRPDIRVNSVIAPVHALVGFPTIIRVSLSELNGELGARANIRVLANGVEVDRLDGFWIDAGDSVSVSLATMFESAGSVDLQVVVDGVNPGDWDDANNTGTAQTTVYEEATPFYNWTSTAHEDTTTRYSYSKTSYSEDHYEGGGTTQQFHLDAQTAAHADLSSLNVSASAESDGQTVIAERTAANWQIFSTPFTRCAEGFDSGIEAVVCNDVPGSRFYRSDRSQVTIDLSNDNVSYHSWGYNKNIRVPGSPTGYATVDVTYVSPYTVIPIGTNATYHVLMSDGATLWKADPFFGSFSTRISKQDQPYQCGYNPFVGNYCSELHVTSTSRDARASHF